MGSWCLGSKGVVMVVVSVDVGCSDVECVEVLLVLVVPVTW